MRTDYAREQLRPYLPREGDPPALFMGVPITEFSRDELIALANFQAKASQQSQARHSQAIGDVFDLFRRS